MPDLVLVNGPPASGKSTVAAALAASRPLTLNLDVDIVRDLLGAWRSRPEDGGQAARRLALAMAREHLAGTGDVIVPQFLARVAFIGALEEATAAVGARFVEVALALPRDAALAAFADRTAGAAEARHVAAADDVRARGGESALAAMCDDLDALLATRPGAHRIDVARGDVAGTVRRVAAAIGWETPG